MSFVKEQKPKRKVSSPRDQVISYLKENESWDDIVVEQTDISRWKWRILGDILILPPIDTQYIKDITSIDRAFRNTFKNVRCVVAHEGRISGELRKPNVQILTPNEETSTIHTENGIKFKIDVTKVMFAAGNGTERMRFSKIIAKDEIVVDMFAGIGYFSMPLSKHGQLKTLISIEKNPDSANLLRQNVKLNHVEDKVLVYEGDNREVAEEWIGKCHRVLMGYLPSAEPFIERAISFLQEDRAIIHYHYIAKKEDSNTLPITQISPYLKGRTINILHIENVKSYAPQLSHYVADIEII